MSVEEKVEEDPRWKIRQKCAECIQGPNLIKTVVIIVCVGVVVHQISTCIYKLIDVPITTYTHFDFNKTLIYPSVTFCREPPYKFDKMREYGLQAHPHYTSPWQRFDFENNSLDDLWENITYNEEDFFLHYGLAGEPEISELTQMLEDLSMASLEVGLQMNMLKTKLMTNSVHRRITVAGRDVKLTQTMGFALGRCYTLTPKILSTHATKPLGYSVSLKHTAQDIATTTSIIPPGYHVYIHYSKEPFTEVTVYNGGMVDSLYVNVGETLTVKLKVDQYKMISSNDDPCVNQVNYSANECTTKYVWDKAVQHAGCSGPWMQSSVPHCSNYSSMRALISYYDQTYENHSCKTCPRICHSLLYNGFVTDRQQFYFWDSSAKTWSLYLYFNSMMVAVYEERYNYDWNLFVSDLGGSIGFLLGLSVIGLMQIFGKTWRTFIEPFIRCKKKSGCAGSVVSGATVDVKNVRQEYIEKWNEKNMADQ